MVPFIPRAWGDSYSFQVFIKNVHGKASLFWINATILFMLWNRILGESGKLPLRFKTSYVQGNFSRLHTNQRKCHLWELIHYSESTVSRRSSWILDTQNGSVTYKGAAEGKDSLPTNQPQNSSGHQIQNNVSPYIIEQMENVPNTDKNLTKLNTLSYGLKSKGIIIGLMVVGANLKHSIKGC